MAEASFWGQILKTGQTFDPKIPEGKNLVISQASLHSLSTPAQGRVSVYAEVNSNKFVLCNLEWERVEQVSLNLCFFHQDPVKFSITTASGNSKSEVHLIGRLESVYDFDNDDFDEEEDDEAIREDLRRRGFQFESDDEEGDDNDGEEQGYQWVKGEDGEELSDSEEETPFTTLKSAKNGNAKEAPKKAKEGDKKSAKKAAAKKEGDNKSEKNVAPKKEGDNKSEKKGHHHHSKEKGNQAQSVTPAATPKKPFGGDQQKTPKRPAEGATPKSGKKHKKNKHNNA